MSSVAIIQFRKGPRVLKSWYGFLVNETMANISLSDLFFKIRNGEIDGENPVPELETADFVNIFAGKSKSDAKIRLDKNLPLQVVLSTIGTYIEFKIDELEPTSSSDTATTNGLSLLMQTASSFRSLPTEYDNPEGNGKNRLRNEIISWLRDNQIGWSPAYAPTNGKIFVEDLAGALWYIDGHHDGLKARGCHVPEMFRKFSGFHAATSTSKKRKRDSL